MALHLCRTTGIADVVALLTTVNEAFDRVSMHGTRGALLRAQAAAAGLPLIEVSLPLPCTNDIYEARMADAMDRVRATGAQAMVFGDLFLADVRAYREARLQGTGIAALFPLWGRPTDVLAQEIIDAGFVAHVVTCDPAVLDAGFAGRRFDAGFLADLPAGVDPCGERGEFHTAVTAGPIFDAPIAVSTGATVLRDGFAYADLVPLGEGRTQR